MNADKSRQRMGAHGGGNENGRNYSQHSRKPLAGQPVYNGKGQVIGSVDGDTFTKRVQASRHMLRKPPAWAIDRTPLQRLANQGITTVVVEDTEGCLTYTASLADFAQHGFVLDRGFGVQVALPLKYWRAEVEGSGDFDRATAAVQLGLWNE